MFYNVRKDKLPLRYHIDLRIKLSDRTKKMYRFDTPRHLAPGFVNDIFDICHEVVSVTVSPHTLSVSHHRMFSWKREILPKIVEVLRINFDPEAKSFYDMSSGKVRCSPSKLLTKDALTNEPRLLSSPSSETKKVD